METKEYQRTQTVFFSFVLEPTNFVEILYAKKIFIKCTISAGFSQETNINKNKNTIHHSDTAASNEIQIC